jgi:glycerophosphoryl diester phosphodiesterase
MPPRFVVHRGGAALGPENSLLAFRNAIAQGAELLELDVHRTLDGRAAVIHDATLDRTTDATGPVAGRTAEELHRVRLQGRDGRLTAEWVPLLDEVAALAAPHRVGLLVEIKTPGPPVRYERAAAGLQVVAGERYEGLEREVLAGLAAASMSERSVVMAFNPAVLAEIRKLAPAQRSALLVNRDHVLDADLPSAEAVAWARAAGADVVGLHHSLCDAAVVAAARRAGLGLGVFTVNDEAEIRRLVALGVDVIITDRADLAARLGKENV